MSFEAFTDYYDGNGQEVDFVSDFMSEHSSNMSSNHSNYSSDEGGVDESHGSPARSIGGSASASAASEASSGINLQSNKENDSSSPSAAHRSPVVTAARPKIGHFIGHNSPYDEISHELKEGDDDEIETQYYRATRGFPVDMKLSSDVSCSSATITSSLNVHTSWPEEEAITSRSQPNPPTKPLSGTSRNAHSALSSSKDTSSIKQNVNSASPTPKLNRNGPFPYLKANSKRSVTPNLRATTQSQAVRSSLNKSTASGVVLTISEEEQVEKMIVNCLRKAEYNHKVQISLGFIDSYVMIPARGNIILSKPRPFLTPSDFQAAFAECGVHFSDNQVDTLIKLIIEFANRFKEDINQNIIVNISQDLGEVSRKDAVSAQWTKKYFCHLRLFERASVNSTDWKSASLNRCSSTPRSCKTSSDDFRRHSVNSFLAAGGDNADGSGASKLRKPKSFENWLVDAVIAKRKKVDDKPKEFRKALVGLSHSLTNEEIVKFLEENSIFPEKYLDAEVAHRINGWVYGKAEATWVYDSKDGGSWKYDNSLDKSGSFSTKMKHEIAKWESLDKKNKFSKIKSASVKKSCLDSFKVVVIDEERQRLLKSEEVPHCLITKSLFYEYLKESNEERGKIEKAKSGKKKSEKENAQANGPMKWGQWLWQNLKKREENLASYKATLRKIKDVSDLKNNRDNCYAAISDITASLPLDSVVLKNIRVNMDKQIEIKKNLVKLQKVARESSDSRNGKLVTRAQFSKLFDNVLNPLPSKALKPELVKIVDESKQFYLDLSKNKIEKENEESNAAALSNTVFFDNALEAEKRQLKNEEAADSEAYKQWKKDKEEKIREEREKRKLAEDLKAKNDAAKKKENAKAFKEWVYLRKINKYQGAGGGSAPRNIPDKSTVKHSTAWNQDADLKAYYARQERDAF